MVDISRKIEELLLFQLSTDIKKIMRRRKMMVHVGRAIKNERNDKSDLDIDIDASSDEESQHVVFMVEDLAWGQPPPAWKIFINNSSNITNICIKLMILLVLPLFSILTTFLLLPIICQTLRMSMIHPWILYNYDVGKRKYIIISINIIIIDNSKPVFFVHFTQILQFRYKLPLALCCFGSNFFIFLYCQRTMWVYLNFSTFALAFLLFITIFLFKLNADKFPILFAA